ncbi:hypothetical protein BCT30_09695 [Enterovibrio norvegicus]|uniref:outer membrane protein n=2 Tax=Enterovibrio norvegicus TaxID=188144 RepID=UPI000C849B85|nr:outer membrane beta-barrel protein [Enterovibrio norvegicus]MCC4799390.1 outer membrane beta-barrel protein [Enterovibrio norvegicus]PMH69760.1 hypothetical protein BCU62_06610 [Enterovibrio norvegicus]PMI34185.1 hypothetical protein BCU46_21015 [Enterovibrio norvegicus]PMN54986.1 hypothetical protein BCT30_09695 [Enterovibrio norvegicus]TKF17591.1 porin family protein [Enterovibrio norvegicus]
MYKYVLATALVVLPLAANAQHYAAAGFTQVANDAGFGDLHHHYDGGKIIYGHETDIEWLAIEGEVSHVSGRYPMGDRLVSSNSTYVHLAPTAYRNFDHNFRLFARSGLGKKWETDRYTYAGEQMRGTGSSFSYTYGAGVQHFYNLESGEKLVSRLGINRIGNVQHDRNESASIDLMFGARF